MNPTFNEVLLRQEMLRELEYGERNMEPTNGSFCDKLVLMKRAGVPLVYIYAMEDNRAIESLSSAIVDYNPELGVAKWDVVAGWQGTGVQKGAGASDPVACLQAIKLATSGVYILQGFHHFLKAPEVIQLIKDLIFHCKNTKIMAVFVSPVLDIPPELEKDFTVVRFKLPGREELRAVVDNLMEVFVSTRPDEPDKLKVYNSVIRNVSSRKRVAAVEAAVGLTELEAENAFSISLMSKHDLDEEMIRKEKAEAIRRSDVLEIFEQLEEMENVGGLGKLKQWLRQRLQAYSPDAKAFGLPLPRGILIVGPPGTGKTMIGKAIAALWRVSLLKLDMGRVYGSLMGQSEGKMRQVIDIVETIGRCILLIDEAEKGLAGTTSSGKLDSGVTARVGGTLLTWMQEKTTEPFVVATCNHIENLPPEFTRKGRMDEIFFVDLPTFQERSEILTIHLTMRGKMHKKLDVEGCSRLMADFSGAEIKAVVEAAMFAAFDDGKRAIVSADLFQATRGTIPLARSRKQEIEAMREWAKTTAVLASASEGSEAAAKPKNRRMSI